MKIEQKNEKMIIKCSITEYNIIVASLCVCAELEKDMQTEGVKVDPICSKLLEKFHKAMRPEV